LIESDIAKCIKCLELRVKYFLLVDFFGGEELVLD
jgi:hypothetical protein